jgi:hypothetical protein
MSGPWLWRDGRNPYRRTPFQALALDPNLRGKAGIRAHTKQRLARIRNAAHQFPVFGEVLTEAQVQAAAARIGDPAGRVYAELCTHRPRVFRVDVDEVAARLNEIVMPEIRPAVTIRPDRLVHLVERPAPREFRPLFWWWR